MVFSLPCSKGMPIVLAGRILLGELGGTYSGEADRYLRCLGIGGGFSSGITSTSDGSTVCVCVCDWIVEEMIDDCQLQNES